MKAMISKNAAFTICLLWLVDSCSGWVLNEISNPSVKMAGEDNYLRLYDDDLTPEEYERMIVQGRFNLIYPETKWCGPGDVADNYDDLGTAVEADKCCRDHDHCPDLIPAGETKHNLTNTSFYTKLSCGCDETFRQCLHDANTKTAKQVGVLYFNIIGTQCYKEDYPVTGCAKESGWLKRKCVQYTFDENGEKVYQWFDVPNY